MSSTLWPDDEKPERSAYSYRYGRLMKRWRALNERGEVCSVELCFQPPASFSEDCSKHRHGTSRIG